METNEFKTFDPSFFDEPGSDVVKGMHVHVIGRPGYAHVDILVEELGGCGLNVSVSRDQAASPEEKAAEYCETVASQIEAADAVVYLGGGRPEAIELGKALALGKLVLTDEAEASDLGPYRHDVTTSTLLAPRPEGHVETPFVYELLCQLQGQASHDY